MGIDKIILAKPRGFCAGVERAIDVVEECLKIFGKPIYVKHEIVHNKHVVDRLEKKGAITVDSIEEIPSGAIAVFSAHGSPPEQFIKAKEKGIKIIDATCPLVTRVHIEVHMFTKKNYKIIYIGHKGHAETIGVLGELPEKLYFVENIEDVNNLIIEDITKLVYLTQTTLSIDETKNIIKALKDKYPQIEDPPGKDICYATTNRQNAVKELARYCDLILVIGSKNSSNSKRLVETAKNADVNAFLIDELKEINPDWLEKVSVLGISSGASVPDYLVQEVVEYFVKQGVKKEELNVLEENMIFQKPRDLNKIKQEMGI